MSKKFARCFGQDLMRGEHVVGVINGQGSDGGGAYARE